MKKGIVIVTLALFLLCTTPVFGNGTAPPPPPPGGSNPNVVPCLLLPFPLNAPYCAALWYGN